MKYPIVAVAGRQVQSAIREEAEVNTFMTNLHLRVHEIRLAIEQHRLCPGDIAQIRDRLTAEIANLRAALELAQSQWEVAVNEAQAWRLAVKPLPAPIWLPQYPTCRCIIPTLPLSLDTASEQYLDQLAALVGVERCEKTDNELREELREVLRWRGR